MWLRLALVVRVMGRGESLTVVAIKRMDGVLSGGTLKAVLSARARLSSD